MLGFLLSYERIIRCSHYFLITFLPIHCNKVSVCLGFQSPGREDEGVLRLKHFITLYQQTLESQKIKIIKHFKYLIYNAPSLK